MAGLFDDEPRDDRPTFRQRDADEHERQNFAEHSGIAGHGGDATRSGDADANGRAAKCQTDVNVAYCFCEHTIFSFYYLVDASRYFEGWL